MVHLRRIQTAAFALGMAFAVVAIVAPASSARAETPAVYVDRTQAAAVGGYDLTSYFAGAPVRGSAQFAATHNGATYHFVNAENRARFLADPSAFLPQYGGYCAWAVSNNYTAPADPTAWRVVDGKLYLNYNAAVQERWARDIPARISSANTNWPNVLKK